MLKELFEKNLPNYYEQVANKETHVYLSNVNKVLEAYRERLRALKVKAYTEGKHDVQEGLHLALCELAFVTSEIMNEQLKTLKDA